MNTYFFELIYVICIILNITFLKDKNKCRLNIYVHTDYNVNNIRTHQPESKHQTLYGIMENSNGILNYYPESKLRLILCALDGIGTFNMNSDVKAHSMTNRLKQIYNWNSLTLCKQCLLLREEVQQRRAPLKDHIAWNKTISIPF